MKNKLLLLIVLNIGILGSLHSQRRLWTTGTANVLSNKDIRASVFQPSAYGLPYSMEISSQPVIFAVVPNISLKKQWYKTKKLSIASKHGFYYPKPLLNILAKHDLTYQLPEGASIPGILSFKNEFLISYGIGETTCPAFTSKEFNRENTFKGPSTIFTYKIGIQNGIALNDTPIDYFFIDKFLFHHSYHYVDKLAFFTGIDIDGRWLTNLDFSVDFDFLLLSNSYWAFEHKGLVNYYWGWKFFHIMLGYQASYGTYPNGKRFFIAPVFDLIWTLRRDKLDYGLFGKKLF